MLSHSENGIFQVTNELGLGCLFSCPTRLCTGTFIPLDFLILLPFDFIDLSCFQLVIRPKERWIVWPLVLPWYSLVLPNQYCWSRFQWFHLVGFTGTQDHWRCWKLPWSVAVYSFSAALNQLLLDFSILFYSLSGIFWSSHKPCWWLAYIINFCWIFELLKDWERWGVCLVYCFSIQVKSVLEEVWVVELRGSSVISSQYDWKIWTSWSSLYLWPQQQFTLSSSNEKKMFKAKYE
jgi:hypothetical protein